MTHRFPMREISQQLYDEIVAVWTDDPAAIYDSYEINAIRKDVDLDLDLDSWDSEEY